MDAINIEHGEGDQAGERPEAGCVLSDKTDSSTQNSSDEATSGSAISSLDDAVLTNSVGSGRIKYGSISSHHGGNDSSPSLYSANALLSGSDGRMSFVSGRESQSSPQKDGNLNSPLPFQMEQHPAVEDNEKRSSLLRQIEAACVPEARSTDKTDTSSKSSSSSKGACAAIGLEQDMSLMRPHAQSGTVSPPSPVTEEKFKSLKNKFEQFYRQQGFRTPNDKKTERQRPPRRQMAQVTCDILAHAKSVATVMTVSTQTDMIDGFLLSENPIANTLTPSCNQMESKFSQTSPLQSNIPLTELCKEWLLTRTEGPVGVADRAIQTHTSMSLLLPDNVDTVYLSDYNPDVMLSAQMFTPGGRVKGVFTAAPYCHPRTKEDDNKVSSVRARLKPWAARAQGLKAAASENQTTGRNRWLAGQNPIGLNRYPAHDSPIRGRFQKSVSQNAPIEDQYAVTTQHMSDVVDLTSRMDSKEPQPIAKMFDYWRAKSAETTAAAEMCTPEASRNTTGSYYEGNSSAGHPGTARSSVRNQPQPKMDKTPAWWRKRTPRSSRLLSDRRSTTPNSTKAPVRSQKQSPPTRGYPGSGTPNSTKASVRSQKQLPSARGYPGSTPRRETSSRVYGRRDQDFSNPSSLQTTDISEGRNDSSSTTDKSAVRYESVQPTNRLVKLWSQVINDHQSDASRNKLMLAGGLKKWRSRANNKVTPPQSDKEQNELSEPLANTRNSPHPDATCKSGAKRSDLGKHHMETVLRKPVGERKHSTTPRSSRSNEGKSQTPNISDGGDRESRHTDMKCDELEQSAKLREEQPQMSRSTSSLIQMEEILTFIQQSGLPQSCLLDSINKCLNQRGQIQRTSTRLDTKRQQGGESLQYMSSAIEGQDTTPIIPPLQLPNSSASSMYPSPPSPVQSNAHISKAQPAQAARKSHAAVNEDVVVPKQYVKAHTTPSRPAVSDTQTVSEHTSGSKSCPKLGVMVLPDPAKDLNTNAAADGSRIVPPSKVKARVKAKLMFMSKLLPPGGPKKCTTMPPGSARSGSTISASNRLRKRRSGGKIFPSYQLPTSSSKTKHRPLNKSPHSCKQEANQTLPAKLVTDETNTEFTGKAKQEIPADTLTAGDNECSYYPHKPIRKRHSKKSRGQLSSTGDKKSSPSSGYSPESSCRKFDADHAEIPQISTASELAGSSPEIRAPADAPDLSCRPKVRQPPTSSDSTSKHKRSTVRRKKSSAPLPPTPSEGSTTPLLSSHMSSRRSAGQRGTRPDSRNAIDKKRAGKSRSSGAGTYGVSPRIDLWVAEHTNPSHGWQHPPQPSDHFLFTGHPADSTAAPMSSVPPSAQTSSAVTSPAPSKPIRSTHVKSSSHSSVHSGISKLMNKLKGVRPHINPRFFT